MKHDLGDITFEEALAWVFKTFGTDNALVARPLVAISDREAEANNDINGQPSHTANQERSDIGHLINRGLNRGCGGDLAFIEYD